MKKLFALFFPLSFTEFFCCCFTLSFNYFFLCLLFSARSWKKKFFSPITSPITARVLTSNLSAILTLKSRLHKKVFPVTWQAAVRMDHFRYIKIQNEIKQKNVLFIAEPQDNLFCFISPRLAYLRTQKFHSEAIISSGFDTELQYTRLFHNFFFYWMPIGRSEKKLQCRKNEEIENMWWSTSELLARPYRNN